jgi:hypothetical protein
MTEVEAMHQMVGNLAVEASIRLVGAAVRVASTPPAGHHRLTGEALPDLSRSCPFLRADEQADETTGPRSLATAKLLDRRRGVRGLPAPPWTELE